MTEYIPIICYVLGVATGIAATIIGYKLGFKASYEIRTGKSGETEGQGLFPSKKDPAEFELLEKEG